jgi:hypothetical protein
MKRMAALMGALLLTLAVAVPAVAAKPPSVTVTVADATCGMEPGDREWESGNMWHGRGLVTHQETFLLVGDAWVPNGTLTVTGDLNVNERIFNAHGPIQVRGSAFGDFDGTFHCATGGCGASLSPDPPEH